jgi:O-antigen/teichoic acid export membrane protein
MIEAKALPRRRVITNLATVYAAQIATSLLSLVPIIFLPVYLGTVGMGKFVFASSFAGVFSSLMILGTPNYVVREIARDHGKLSEIVCNAAALRLLLAGLMLPLAIAILFIFGYPADTRTITLWMYGVLTLRVTSYTVQAALQAIENMTWRSAAVIVKEVLAVSLGWLALRQGGGVIGYVLILGLADTIEFLINAAYFVLVRPFQITVRWAGIIQIFRGGLPFFLWAFLQTIYMQASSLMLSKLGGEESVGLFGTASQFLTSLFTIPAVAVTVLLPRLSQLHGLETGVFRKTVAKSANYMTIIMMPLAFGMAAIADRVIDLFGYPASFQRSVPVLQLLALNLPGTALLMVMATAVSAMNKERGWAKISVFSVISIVVLNPLLIPVARLWFDNPAIGGAAADFVAELLTLALTLRLIGWTMIDRTIFVTIGKTGLAGAVMAAGVLAARSLPLAVMIALGAAIYIGAIYLLKALPADDLHEFQRIVMRRWRGYMQG